MSGVMIRYGAGDNIIDFKGDELRNVKIIQSVNPLSSQIEISTCDFTLDSKRDIEYSFQERQPLSIYFNDKLKATMFIKSVKRKSKNIWDIQSEDYIGLLDSITYPGNVFHGDVTASNVIEIILRLYANVPFSLNIKQDKPIWGWIPYTTCREALMHIAFVTGWIVDTSDSSVINIYEPSDDVTQHIPLNRIMQGQNFDEENNITAIEIISHIYEADVTLQGMEQVVLYDASKNGAGQNIRLMFDEPIYDRYLTDGEIIESSANHIVFNINENGKLIGYPYNHTTYLRKLYISRASESDKENIISIQDATLVNPNYAEEVLNRCFQYYVGKRKTNLKIIEGKHEKNDTTTNFAKYGSALYGSFIYGEPDSGDSANDQPTKVGEVITYDTDYLGTLSGRITKQTFNLNGNIIIKDTEIWGNV